MYYQVLPASRSYWSDEPLVYNSKSTLQPGAIVKIDIKGRFYPAIIYGTSKKPDYPTKSINELIVPMSWSKHHLEWLDWIKQYYPAKLGVISSLFAPNFLLNIVQKQKTVTASTTADRRSKLPPLTAAQMKVLGQIAKNDDPIILHGDTASGKTRIYLEMTDKSFKNGQSAVILTPEIGLTAQLYNSFNRRFGDKTVLYHSDQTPAQRRNNWLKIVHSPYPLVVIGPRSAIFSPLTKIGLIVIDEFHDSSYKQDQAPYYQTSRLAGKLAKLTSAKLILASATPNISDYYIFLQQKRSILRMIGTAKPQRRKSKIEIVDLLDRSQFNRSPWLSDKLIKSVENALAKGQQAAIFLNRRGTARVLACQNCGWQAKCPKCDLPLTYHADMHRAVCHTCAYKTVIAPQCPQCHGTDIIFKSAGSKQILIETEKLFPNSNVARFDSDNLKTESLDKRYDELKSGAIDIIVGTQKIAKGLDLPKLAVMAIISADTSLHFPDYTATERTYQLIHQLAGRVGRGHQTSSVILQTAQPSSDLIKWSLNGHFEQFYNHQITEREEFKFPPFCYVLKLSASHKIDQKSRLMAEKLAESLTKNYNSINIGGPMPAWKHKQAGNYRWNIVIKAKNRPVLTDIIKKLPANISYDIDPSDLL